MRSEFKTLFEQLFFPCGVARYVNIAYDRFERGRLVVIRGRRRLRARMKMRVPCSPSYVLFFFGQKIAIRKFFVNRRLRARAYVPRRRSMQSTHDSGAVRDDTFANVKSMYGIAYKRQFDGRKPFRATFFHTLIIHIAKK